MSKVYIHDEATGVCVVDNSNPHFPVRINWDDECSSALTSAEFRKVIEGGLRWMLENDTALLNGERQAIEIVLSAMEKAR
jgi:hypothetical protein